ncbi:MAG TPA: hypothetical protein VIT65_22160 [Microlunatus sp.]
MLPFYFAPGLSAVTEPALTPGALGTRRYRRWVERLLLQTEARRRKTAAASAPTGSDRRRIRLTSPTSGTLSRLP